ncbi:MAG: hypothetical protein JWO58_3376, partial [Chitinophagaceae bacterium]|nr:hypothetical protein [Chitinophagaceae bacterium]
MAASMDELITRFDTIKWATPEILLTRLIMGLGLAFSVVAIGQWWYHLGILQWFSTFAAIAITTAVRDRFLAPRRSWDDFSGSSKLGQLLEWSRTQSWFKVVTPGGVTLLAAL